MRRFLEDLLKQNNAQRISKSFWSNCRDTHLAPSNLYDLQEISLDKNLVPLLDAKETVLLDIGCGDGRFSQQLASNCLHIDAIDLSPYLVEQAQARFKNAGLANIQAMVKDFSASGRDCQYDAILATGFLTTIAKHSVFIDYLHKFQKQLKINGYLTVRDSLTDGPTQIKIMPKYLNGKDYAACYRNQNEYKRFFSEAGWELIAEDHLSSSPDQSLKSVLFVFKRNI